MLRKLFQHALWWLKSFQNFISYFNDLTTINIEMKGRLGSEFLKDHWIVPDYVADLPLTGSSPISWQANAY
jgi:hypothetical protein